VISCAQTGTGKTAAFILPLLTNLLYDNHDPNKLNAIIMAPTRELAQQIDQQMEGFGFYVPFSSVAIYGGNDGGAWGTQSTGLQKGADIVIATPGRLLSLMNIYNIDFSGVKYFILDEADRMLDMGFLPDISRILKLLPQSRQSLMFSATFSPEIKALAGNFLRSPKLIEVARENSTARTITQKIYEVHDSEKMDALLSLLDEDDCENAKQILVFVNSKITCRRLARALEKEGIKADSIHGDKNQEERTKTLEAFKHEEVRVLVATDVAARGLDIAELPVVINFDVPFNAEDYVHRIGRTGRAGAKGVALMLVTAGADDKNVSAIEHLIKEKFNRIRLDVMPHRRAPSRGPRKTYTPPPVTPVSTDPFFNQPYEPSAEALSRTQSAPKPLSATKASTQTATKRKAPVAALLGGLIRK
jgi:superfamily II DNA/RNA helicase